MYEKSRARTDFRAITQATVGQKQASFKVLEPNDTEKAWSLCVCLSNSDNTWRCVDGHKYPTTRM